MAPIGPKGNAMVGLGVSTPNRGRPVEVEATKAGWANRELSAKRKNFLGGRGLLTISAGSV